MRREIGSGGALVVLATMLAAAPVSAQTGGTSSTAGAAQAPLELTLERAIELALRDGQEVALARLRIDLAESQIQAARAQVLPSISGTAGYTRTFASAFDTGGSAFTIPDELKFEPDPTLPLEERVRYLEDKAPNAGLQGIGALFSDLPFGQPNTYSATMNVSQLVYSGGQVAAALNIAGHLRSAAELTLAEDAAEVRRQVRTAYYQALLAQELTTIAEEGLAQADRVLEYEQIRREAGQVAELDVLRAEVARDNLRPQLVAATNALDLALLNLKRLIDVPLREPVRLTSPLVEPSGQDLADTGLSPDLLNAQRAALLAAEREVLIREETVSIVRGSYRPRVTFDMAYGKQVFPSGVFDLASDWRTDWTAGLTVRVPIFTGFQRGADIAQAQVERRQAELQLAQARQAVQLEYEQALGEKERARAAIAARRRTAEVAERAYELTLLVFEQGLTTQLQVADSRLQLLQARSNLAQAIADFHIADAGVVRAQTPADLSGLPSSPGIPPVRPTSVLPTLRSAGPAVPAGAAATETGARISPSVLAEERSR